MSATQDAILVTEIGKPVQLGRRAVPEPRNDEVRVKVTATMILPHDTLGRDIGIIINERLPAVLGGNIAGVIDRLGQDATTFKVGDLVFGISELYGKTSNQAGLQEYATLNADAIAKVPENISVEEAVSLPINLVTSWTVLFTKHGFNIPSPLARADSSNTSIVIIGGGTNVGQLGVQLARLAGIGKIIVVAGPSNADLLTEMGATHVIDRHSSPEDIARQVQSITGSSGAKYVYDCANMNLDLAITIIAQDQPATLRTLLPFEPDEAAKVKAQRPLADASFMDDVSNKSIEPYTADFWSHVPTWLVEGKLQPSKYRVINGLDKVKEIK